jgi:O-antigen/teichoic acid export membrane protein
MSGTVRSLLQVVAVRALGLGLTSLAGLAITWFLLRQFGVETYAFYSLLVAIPSILVFGDLGTGASLVNAIAVSPDPQRDVRVGQHLLSCLRITAGFAAALSLVAGLLYALDLWPALLNVDAGMRGTSAVAALVAVLFAVSLPLSLGQRLFLGLQKSHLWVILQSLQLPLTLVLVLGQVYLLGSRDGQFVPIAFFVSLVIVGALSLLWVRRYLAAPVGWAFRHLLSRRTRGAKVMDLGLPMLAQTMLVPIAVQSDRIILAHLSTTQELALYALAAQVFAGVQSLIAAAGLSLWPVFTRQRIRGETAKPGLYAVGFLGIAAAMCAIILVFQRPLFELLSDGKLEMRWSILLGFTLAACVQAVLYPVGMSMMDLRSVRFQVVPILASVTANIGLSVLWAPSMGATGPVLATAVATLVFQLIPFAVYSRLRRSRREGHDVGNGSLPTEEVA